MNCVISLKQKPLTGKSKSNNADIYFMIKKTVLVFLFCCICLSAAHARIGSSVDDFRKSEFAAAEGFTFHDSYQLTDDPVYQGRYAHNFFTADKRYKLQLIADRKGENIVFEYLFYPAADGQAIALKDGSIAISFAAHASAQAIAPGQFVSLVSEANMGARNVKYTRDINGYTVALTRYDTKMLSGWSIGIHK